MSTDEGVVEKPKGEAESAENPPTSAVKRVEAEIAPILSDLPPAKKDLVLHKIEESLTAVIATGFSSGPKLDPEAIKILTDTVKADNDNKFKYLSQKEQHDSEHRSNVLGFQRECHRDHVGLLKPCIIVAIGLVAISTLAGLWFIAQGREAIGAGILSSTATAIFGFLGGLGVSSLLEPKRKAP